MVNKYTVDGDHTCWFWHKWDRIYFNGVSEYFVCSKCNSRKVKQNAGCYQPIDWKWMHGKTNDLKGME